MATRAPLSKPAAITVVGLLAFAAGSLWTFFLDLIVLSSVIVPAIVLPVVLIGAAALVWLTGARWAPAAAAVVALVLLIGNFAAGVAAERLSEPESTAFLLATWLSLLGGAVAAVAGVVASMQRYRSSRTAVEG